MPRMTQHVADQAAAIATTHQAAINRIMTNPDLSIEGKQREAAKAHQSAVDRMQVLRDNFEGGAAVTADTLGKSLFGGQQLLGQDALSMRDAHDRASRIDDPAEAQQLIARAGLDGDEHLAKAVASRAYGMAQDQIFGAAWAPVLAAYTATRPDAAEQIQQMHDAKRQTTNDGITNAMTFYLGKPDVLSRFHDHQIAALAEEGQAGA